MQTFRTIPLTCALLAVGAVAVTPQDPIAVPKAALSLRFDDMDLDAPPKGCSIACTGAGGEAAWKVTSDPSSPAGERVLTQTSEDDTNARYPLCVVNGWSARDVSASVRFRAVKGQVDRAAGIVVRYKDKDNYYVVRANSLEDNVRLYHVTNGKRVQFAGLDHVTVKENVWHTLTLEAAGSHFRVGFNGQQLFEADDTTITEPGLVGLWTKADSITNFDDFDVREVRGQAGAALGASPAKGFDFEKGTGARIPEGLTPLTSPDSPGLEWFVLEDAGKSAGPRVLTSRSVATASAPAANSGTASRPAGSPARRANYLFVDGWKAKDLTLRFRFKTQRYASSNEPGMRTAGVVLRYKDKDDYCVLRVNPREDNCQLNRMRGGKRTQLGEIHHKAIAEGEWHLIEVQASGPKVRVLCDGELLFEGVDTVDPVEGGVALVGSADAGTLYDDLTFETKGRP